MQALDSSALFLFLFSNLGLKGVACGGVWRWSWVGLDATPFHVGDELVWDLSKDIFSQPSHAQHMVSCAVNVIPEWNKLQEKNICISDT